MDAGLRSRRRDDVDRRHRRGAVEPERRLGRHRRSQQPTELLVGRRRLQVASTPDGRGSPSGLADTRHIGRIVIHPSNPDIVYVAAVGHLWGSNASAASSRPTDGGRTWTKVLYVDDNTGATDLVMDPQDPQTLFAAMYQRQRKAWGFNGGGPGSGIFRTPRRRRAPGRGCRTGCRRATRDASASTSFSADPRVVFAVVEAAGRESGVYRSADAATRGRRGPRSTRGRCTSARSAPIRKTRMRVYLLGSNRGFYISDDGGKTFARRVQHDPLRGSRALDRSRRHEPSDRRRRRRRVDLVGPRPDLAVPRQPAGRAVLRDQRRHAGSVRRSAAACRTTATGACRARRARAPASRTTTASTSAAATASTRASIRPTRAPRSSNRRTAAPTASTCRRSSGRRSRRVRRGGRRHRLDGTSTA